MNRERIWCLAAKKLANEASPEELAELESLLRSDPDMHYALQNVNDIWHLPVRQTEHADEAFARHTERMNAAGLQWKSDQQLQQEEYQRLFPSGKSRKRAIGIITLVAAIVAVGLFYATRQPVEVASPVKPQASDKNEISTRYGLRSDIHLPDGSRVWLNSGSTLNYGKNFGNKVREVELTGEAFFDVVRNVNLPFVIHTKSMDIKVLGTQFNVKAYPNEKTSEASLIRGSIEVVLKNGSAEKITLKPNHKIVVPNEIDPLVNGPRRPDKAAIDPPYAIHNLTYEKRDSSIVETSWVDNKLVFEDESFRELAIKMERWYGASIEFSDESLQQLRFHGSFKNESLQDALHALNIGATFSYKIENNVVTISK